MFNRLLVATALVAVLSFPSASAYYYLVETPAGTVAIEAPAPAEEPAAAAEQAVQAAEQQVQLDGSKLPSRISGHVSQLYNHGSTAIHGLADSVQPDLKNLGQDITDAYKATRTQVGKKIEPLAQTVRPYIDHAQKVVAPYVDQAKQEVPKLIHQVGPAVSKVGEHVKQVWNSLTNGEQHQQQQPAAEQVQQTASNVIEQVQVTGQQTKEALASVATPPPAAA